MLRILTETPEVETEYTFPLDAFQKKAIYAIQHDENVLVTAKTGSGKTLVGEYQISHSLKKGKRVFYTTPIKSLSNQKFHDLKQMYPSVGIMTGDIKFCPHADVVVMTTEILRNLLFKVGSSTEHIGSTASLSLDGVDSIVFDEVHYINNPERGKVWEECLILLPREMNLVLLSATIDSPELFAEWLGDLKQKPIHLISTQYRVVPLQHCVGDFKVVMNEKDVFDRGVYSSWIRGRDELLDKDQKHKEQVRNRRLGGYEDASIVREDRTKSFLCQMNELVVRLQEKELLPAMFFVFSRKQCEQYAAKVEHDLLTSSETASVKHIVTFHLSRYPELQTLAQYHSLFALLQKGIAFHHSGLLPVLKEIVELLFARGFVKLLFATETFAVGINMPTKTVIFTSFRKFDTTGMRMLRTDEYIQMAGRAGRRGKDTRGMVMYLPDRNPEPLEEVQRMMTGKQLNLVSRMDFHYDFLLKSLQSNSDWLDIIEKSYWYQQRKATIELCDDELRVLEAKHYTVEQSDHFVVRQTHETTIKNTNNAERKNAQRLLDQWKNTHAGPRWEVGWKAFLEQQKLSDAIDRLKDHMETLRRIEVPFLENLETMGFVKDKQLTELGTMASEVNEAHPLILALAYADGVCSPLRTDELVACMGCFMESDDIEQEPSIAELQVPDQLKDAMRKMNVLAGRLQMHETTTRSLPEFWMVHTYWTEILYRWMNDADITVLCHDYGIYEGNFTKAILKVANIVEEWTNLATFKQDLETLEKLRDIRPKLVRGIVVPDSIYLRL